MLHLTPLTAPAALAGPWCNADARTSAALEAVSLVTPALERFFIRTVADCLPLDTDQPELERLCREFIREEAEHTVAHRQLNAALIDYMKLPPPGLAAVERLLDVVTRRLPLSPRVALVAALEHFTAVLSKSYLCSHGRWQFGCPYARDLFQQHALEEIDHRSVAFDLWLHRGGGSVPIRLVTIAAILLVGTLYLGVATPWILHRKNGGRFSATLAGLLARGANHTRTGSALKEIFRYVRRAYHPKHLIDETGMTSEGRQP